MKGRKVRYKGYKFGEFRRYEIGGEGIIIAE